MAGNITLESLIRKEDDNPVSGRDVLVIFDHGRREVLPKLPLLGFGRSIETYVVQPDVWTQDRVIRNAIRPVRSSVVEEVHLYISYSLCCPSGRQDRAVLALAGDAGADGDLCIAWERRLLRYFEELAEAQARTGGDFVLDFFSNRNDFIQQVSLRLASETGLSVRLRLQLDGENALAKLDALDVTTGRTDVRPKGLNNDFSIQVKGRFRIVETLRSQALLRLLAAEEQEERLVADLVYEIKNEVQQFVAGQVSIDGFAAQAADETRIRLRDSLNERLASRHGRMFDHVDILMPDVGHQRPGLVRLEHNTSVKPSDSKTELPIVSDVAMQLDNPGRLQAMYQQDPLAADPEAWLRHHLEPIVRDALFNQTYADLVVNLDNDLIRVPLVAKAREIGYIIKHYSAVPEQPVLRLRRDGVRFTTGVQEYGTRNTRINVALDIAVTAEMPTALASIERFIRPEIDLEQEMRQTVVDEVRSILHPISPEVFYTTFSFVESVDDALVGLGDTVIDPQGAAVASPVKPIEEQIRIRVAEKLAEKCRLEKIHVTPKMADTALTRRYSALCTGIHNLSFSVSSLADSSSASVPFVVSFKVTGMAPDGWMVFQTNGYSESKPEDEIAAIKGALIESLSTSLAVLPMGLLRYRTMDAWAKVHECARVAQKAIARIFGLSIIFNAFRREFSADEQVEQLRRVTARTNEIERYQTALEDARTNRKADSGDLTALREKLNERIKSGLPPDDPEVAAYVDAIGMQRNSNLSLLEYSPEPEADPDASEVDVRLHTETLLDPGGRIDALEKGRREKTTKRVKGGTKRAEE